jgi:hypothetical protein
MQYRTPCYPDPHARDFDRVNVTPSDPDLGSLNDCHRECKADVAETGHGHAYPLPVIRLINASLSCVTLRP